MKTLLKNALVVTMNDKEEVYSEGSVLIVDDKISKVGHFELKEDVDEVIDCKGKIVMPGLVNTHVHTSQQLGRGLGDDVNLLTWLHDRIWPYESNMTEEDSYVSTLACCLEQIKCGCTSFAEPGGQHVSGMVRGVAEAGLRAKLAKSEHVSVHGAAQVFSKNPNMLFHPFVLHSGDTQQGRTNIPLRFQNEKRSAYPMETPATSVPKTAPG